jgi:hypothetical protein
MIAKMSIDNFNMSSNNYTIMRDFSFNISQGEMFWSIIRMSMAKHNIKIIAQSQTDQSWEKF